jgi:hypothetical protein
MARAKVSWSEYQVCDGVTGRSGPVSSRPSRRKPWLDEVKPERQRLPPRWVAQQWEIRKQVEREEAISRAAEKGRRRTAVAIS